MPAERPLSGGFEPREGAVEALEAEREIVMEEGRDERSALLQKIFNKKVADVALNFTPGVDVGKLTAEAMMGKTMGGKELSPAERRTYVAVAGMVALAYTLHFAGMKHEAVAARLLGGAIAGLELSPDLIRDIALHAKGKFPSAAMMLERAGEFLDAGKPFVAEATRAISNYVRNDPDFVFLKLDPNV